MTDIADTFLFLNGLFALLSAICGFAFVVPYLRKHSKHHATGLAVVMIGLGAIGLSHASAQPQYEAVALPFISAGTLYVLLAWKLKWS